MLYVRFLNKSWTLFPPSKLSKCNSFEFNFSRSRRTSDSWTFRNRSRSRTKNLINIFDPNIYMCIANWTRGIDDWLIVCGCQIKLYYKYKCLLGKNIFSLRVSPHHYSPLLNTTQHRIVTFSPQRNYILILMIHLMISSRAWTFDFITV